MQFITIVKKTDKKKELYLKSKTRQIMNTRTNTIIHENVSTINGLMMTFSYLFINNKTFNFEFIKELNNTKTFSYHEDNIYKKLIDIYQCIVDRKISSIENILEFCNYYNSYFTGYTFQTKQISSYNWIKHHNLNPCLSRLYDKIPREHKTTFEYFIKYDIVLYEKPCSIIGVIDIVDHDQNTIYEIKCVSNLTEIHILQLALYMYLWKNNHQDPLTKFKLYNVIDDEEIEINSDLERLENMVDLITLTKYAIVDEEKQENIEMFLKDYTKLLHKTISLHVKNLVKKYFSEL
jgi:hypothetical protein